VDRSVVWKAFADFTDMHRESRKVEDDWRRIKRAEDEANQSSVASSAKVDAANVKRDKSQKNLTATVADYTKARTQASRSESDSLRASQALSTEQDKQARGLRAMAQQVKAYAAAVERSASVNAQAGGGQKALATAQKAQAQAMKESEQAADRLAAAERRLANQQRTTAKDVVDANNARARAANTAERAALALAAAEDKLQRVPTPRQDQVRKAELSLADARISSSRAATALESAEGKLRNARSRSGRDSDHVRKAEHDVALAMNATVAAASKLENATKKVSGIFDALQGAGSGLGGILGGIQQGLSGMGSSLAGMLPKLALFAVAIPLIASLISVLISGVVSLGAAAVALTSALAPMVGILGALPGAIGGAIFAIGTLAAAFSGVGDAVKESLAVQKNAGKVAKDSAKAQKDAARRVSDAVRNLARAKEAAARGEIAANRAVRDARQALADAQLSALDGAESARRNVTSSERSLTDAQDQARQAQINLNQARQDAVRNIADLKKAVEDLALSEERSSLSVEQARQRLQDVLNDPNATALEKHDAELAVKEALSALKDTKQQAEDTRKEYAKAQKQGVEKSDAVVAAKKAEQDAILNLADAQRSVVDALKAQTRQQVDSARSIQRAQENLADAITAKALQQRDAADSVADAQRNVSDAYQGQKDAAQVAIDATEKLRQAMENLSPAGQKFVKFLLTMKPLLDKIRFAAQEGLFPGLTEALKSLSELAPVITPAVERMGKSIGDAAANVGKLMASPLFKEQLARVLDSSIRIMDTVGRIVGNLVSIFMNVADAARPFTEWLFTTVEGWTEQWKAMTSGKKGQKRLTDFFQETKDVLQIVGGLLLDFGKALFGIGKASKGVGKDFLKALAEAATKFAEFVNSKEGQARIKKWFEDMKPIAESVAKLFKDVVVAVLQIANDPKAAQFFDKLRTELLPALVDFFTTLGSGPAQAAMDVLGFFTSMTVDNLDQLKQLFDNLKFFADLLPGLGGKDGKDSVITLGNFLKILTGIMELSSGLYFVNQILTALKLLVQWFMGDSPGQKASGDGGPVSNFAQKIQKLKDTAKTVLDWFKNNWSTLLPGYITEPVRKAIAWIQLKWAEFAAWFTGKLYSFLNWVHVNWAKLTNYLAQPLLDGLSKMKKLGGDIQNFFQDLWDGIKLGAEVFVADLGKRIDGLRKIFSDPIGYVVDVVINGNLIDPFNQLVSKITGSDKLNIPHVTRPGFASGGVYPGYTPGRDIGYIGVSGGEAIMRPEWTRAVGKGEVDRMNAAARRGGKQGVQKYLGGFSNGGQVNGGGGGEFAPTTFRGKQMNYRSIKMLLAAERLLGSQFRITQGSYSTSVKASGDTHAGGGAVDLGWTGSDASVKALRRAGWAAWHRRPSQGPWADHIHAVAVGDPTESAAAKRQVADYLAGGNGLGGVDDGPRVPIDPNLIAAFGITDADIAAAQAGGGNFLDKLAGWVKNAVSNPVAYLKDKIAKPVSEMFSQFGNGILTQTLAKLPEYAMSAMGDVIKNSVGGFLDNIIPGGGGKSSISDLKSLVQSRATAYGWGDGGNWDALQWIVQKESGWNPTAKNPNSTAYGLFQFLDATWADFGGAKTSDPGVQTEFGLRYIKQRYGTPENARSFHQNYGWYAGGGVVPSAAPVSAYARGGTVGGVGNRDSVPAMLTPGEFVLRKDVAKKIGRRKLEKLNNGKSSSLKPTDAGLQHFHAGGPVLNMKKGWNGGAPIRALRYLLGWPVNDQAQYSQWDGTLDAYLKKPGAAGRLTGPPAVKIGDPNRWKFINYLKSAKSPRTFDQAKSAMNLSDPYMTKLWQSVSAYTQKSMPREKWGAFNNGYLSYFNKASGWIKSLNTRLGLGSWGTTWNGYGRNAMHHVLEHAYGQKHNALEYRPWQYLTPAETAAQNAVAANKKQGEFNTALETLSGWGLTDLVQDLLGQGVDQGYNVALSAAKNQTVATILNNELKKSKLLSSDDQANILKMISTLSSSAVNLGLRDVARALQLSDLDTVTLVENAKKLGRFSKLPNSKMSKLNTDIAAFRNGTFYAATGGEVPGSGTGDTVPAMLTPGEFVLQKAAAQALGIDYLHMLNNPKKFAQGGLVSQFALARPSQLQIPRVGAAVRSGAAGSATTGGLTISYDIDIHNPVAETSTLSLTKTLQRQSVIRGAQLDGEG
jgi:phage-related protein